MWYMYLVYMSLTCSCISVSMYHVHLSSQEAAVPLCYRGWKQHASIRPWRIMLSVIVAESIGAYAGIMKSC